MPRGRKAIVPPPLTIACEHVAEARVLVFRVVSSKASYRLRTCEACIRPMLDRTDVLNGKPFTLIVELDDHDLVLEGHYERHQRNMLSGKQLEGVLLAMGLGVER